MVASSGTAALYSMYAACGIGAGDEVIVPAYTFFAIATPLLHFAPGDYPRVEALHHTAFNSPSGIGTRTCRSSTATSKHCTK
ncbi:DegT/DnrJ/EryC1/StrS family aminotransferase [Nocardia abscessus]|uniref:DegT/DnrJ/EryC1/StrS family aminotransferase n=1 Tax=Nocardia abscessus TaxID=120957 RepID=UPI002B4B17E5|nr:DegT/DnrJ/EryC1/StrS family aminotransferase [Nocardia abscessus]